MVYRKNSRKKMRGRRGGRRRRRYNRTGKPTLTIVKNPQIVPDRYRCKLKYMDSISWNAVAGAAYWYQFRGNSVFDPNYTGVGQQPAGLDQLNGLYKNYKVYASKMKVEFVAGTSTTPPTICTVIPSDTSTGISALNVHSATLNPYSKHSYVVSSIGGAAVKSVQNYMTTKRIFGEQNIDDEDYGALITANPTNTWYWNVGVQSADQLSTSTGTMIMYITYYIELDQIQPFDYS